MKIQYEATTAEMTALAQLLTKRHRGRVELRFVEDGVVAIAEGAPSVHTSGSTELAGSSPIRLAA